MVVHQLLKDRIGNAPGCWNLVRCSNPDCGLVWIDPMPEAATLTKAYESYYTHMPKQGDSGLRRLYLRARNSRIRTHFNYPTTEHCWWVRWIGALLALLPHRRIAMDALVLWLRWKPRGQLLEIGCGDGGRLALLQDFGWKVLGIEPDSRSAQIAHDRGLDVRPETLQPDAFPAGSFDAILMSHVIEHVPAPTEIIRETLRLLRPGGELVMLTPNTDSLGHRWFGRHWLHLDPPRHLHLFNNRNLPKLCSDTGFIDVRCTSTPRDANWTLGASVALQRNDRYVVGRLPLATRLLGLCLFYFEWIVLFFRPALGEEILVRATKRSQP
jgi:SAM-dependent methyltransferase